MNKKPLINLDVVLCSLFEVDWLIKSSVSDAGQLMNAFVSDILQHLSGHQLPLQSALRDMGTTLGHRSRENAATPFRPAVRPAI